MALRDVPAIRVRARGAAPVRPAAGYVLYWMTAARRTGSSFALDRAVGWARELGRPLVVLEALGVDYRWASARLHRFALDGMADNARRLAGRRVLHYPYVEPVPGAGRGLLEALAARAAVVVTDDYPCFFLPRDELVTWRELCFNACRFRPDDYDRYDSLPAWARATLATHARDRRPWVYSLPELEAGRTHDPLWNAAQSQLVREGRLHNYLRMLWGKKILERSPTPREALRAMIELNNKYALDGRDPKSYSGIFWVLGRYDRPWGPTRPIFGSVRHMSSENTARKLRVREYVKRYAGP